MATGPVYVGAIDQGTTSSRFVLFDGHGKIVASTSKEHKQIYPNQGWLEHDPMEIYAAVQECVATTLGDQGLRPEQLTAVGITNQRETTVVWDRTTGKPFYNAIVWSDTRTIDICEALADDGGQDRFAELTGLPIVPYFSASKLKWILDNVDGVRAAAEAGTALFGTIDTWLVWNLTGGVNGGLHITDVTNASRTLLMGLKSLAWDDGQLAVFGVPKRMLPEIRSSSEVYGKCTAPVLAGVPIAGILGDQQAALFGQACFQRGQAKCTYGTGGFLLCNTGTEVVRSKSGMLTTVAYKIGDQPCVYGLEGSVAVAGSLIQWLRDNLKIIPDAPSVETLATSVSDNGGVYFVPAFSGLFAPRWRFDARGVIAGLTAYATQGHIARAALEATAFQVKEVLEAMGVDGVAATRLKVDGGMTANKLLMQFQADVLNTDVVRAQILETTALGAAYAALLATGVYTSVDQLAEMWSASRVYTPSMPADERASTYAAWNKAVTKSFGWVAGAGPDEDKAKANAAGVTHQAAGDDSRASETGGAGSCCGTSGACKSSKPTSNWTGTSVCVLLLATAALSAAAGAAFARRR